MTKAPPRPAFENICDCRKGRRRVASSGQLEAFRNVSVSHVNSKRDLGTEISAREASLRRGSAKNNCILVKMEITVSQSKSQAVKVSPRFPFFRKHGVKCILMTGGL